MNDEFEKNERREFIKKSLSMGMIVGGSFLTGNSGRLFANEAVNNKTSVKFPDII